MGKFGIFVNVWACAWTFFVSIIFILPTVMPVTGDLVSTSLNIVHSFADVTQMNYASAFLALILGAAAIFWYTNGRKYYTGPLIEARVGEGSESERNSVAMDRKADKDDDINPAV
jgi:hypothetical protein